MWPDQQPVPEADRGTLPELLVIIQHHPAKNKGNMAFLPDTWYNSCDQPAGCLLKQAVF